jgi:hypothetical protein
MPFDIAAEPQSAWTLGAGPRRLAREDMTLGVFLAGGEWKVYSPFDRASAYPTRGQALAAAQARARQALRDGRRVELFVQDEDGALGQAEIALA